MRSLLFSCLLVAISAPSAFADAAGVFPVRGTNLAEGEAAAIGVLIATSYAAQSGKRVLGPADTAPALAQAGSTSAAARQLGLSEYIEVDAVRLSTRISVSASLRNVHGSVLYQAKTTAISLDDMEVVAERIAESLHRRTPLQHTQQLDTVTGKETSAPNRTFTEKIIGFRLAGVLPVAADLESNGALMAQFDLRLEGSSYFLEVAGGFMLPSQFDGGDDGVGGLIGQLGASYYLSSTSVSPYIGGGISPRILFGAYEGAGLALGARAGLMFMRQSSARIYLELALDQNVLPLDANSYDYYSDGTGDRVRSDVWPTELSLAVGIGW